MTNFLKKVKGRIKYYKEMWGLYTYKGIECLVTHNDVKFKIIANSKIELYNRARDFTFEKVTIEWIDKFINNGDTVYDIGANIGIYSLLIAKKYPSSKVISIEPEAGNFYKLNKNIMLNNIENILPFPVGISDKTGLSKFFVSSSELGSSCHSLDFPFSDGKEFVPKNEQGIATYTLADFSNSGSIPFPNHIKIDVDGFEDKVMKGLETIIIDPRLKTIVIEINPFCKEKVLDILCNSGFTEKLTEVWSSGTEEISNILFTKV